MSCQCSHWHQFATSLCIRWLTFSAYPNSFNCRFGSNFVAYHSASARKIGRFLEPQNILKRQFLVSISHFESALLFFHHSPSQGTYFQSFSRFCWCRLICRYKSYCPYGSWRGSDKRSARRITALLKNSRFFYIRAKLILPFAM